MNEILGILKEEINYYKSGMASLLPTKIFIGRRKRRLTFNDLDFVDGKLCMQQLTLDRP